MTHLNYSRLLCPDCIPQGWPFLCMFDVHSGQAQGSLAQFVASWRHCILCDSIAQDPIVCYISEFPRSCIPIVCSCVWAHVLDLIPGLQ